MDQKTIYVSPLLQFMFLLAIPEGANLYPALCVILFFFVTENHETSTTLCGTVQILASAVHMYAGWIANIAND